MIQFNDTQLEAIRKAIHWYFAESFSKQIFAIGGLAGTGKSTVVNTIVKMLGIPLNDVIFATLTAKASLVLRLKGNPSNTIHKTFYNVYKTKNSFGFSLRHRLPSNIKLIVIDECSMINNKMLEDIKSFGIPIILLGDPGQLEPIFGTNDYMSDENNLDVFLTQVMRQDDTSGILDICMKARNGEPLDLGTHKAVNITTFSKIVDIIHTYDMVLCYSNKNRRLLNNMIRQKLGYTSIYPSVGEKVLCMMNNYSYQLEYNEVPIFVINGLMGYVKEDAIKVDRNDLELINIKFTPDFLNDIDDRNMRFNAYCFREIFEQYQKDPSKEAFIEELYDDKLEDDELGDVCMIDYGFAFTCHKAQGSEYDHPLVVVDIKGKGPDFYNKWMYTACSRAKKALTVAFLD